jgi:hypothetical protein
MPNTGDIGPEAYDYADIIEKRERFKVKELKRKWNDGSHCGLTDWYPDLEKTIKMALKRKKGWTTGWYASKKEIASANISMDNDGSLLLQVSVSDDFDTEGTASVIIDHTEDLDVIREELDRTWDLANQNQRDNRTYIGYAVGARKGNKRLNYLETYLVGTDGSDSPPGDNYHDWGWQGEIKGMTKKDRIKLAAQMENGVQVAKAGKWIATIWED